MSAGRALDSRLALVGCVSGKREGTWPAADLYRSPLFRGRRAMVERAGMPWYIASAKHGLLEPATLVETYNSSLADLCEPERQAWADRLVVALAARAGSLAGMTVELHAGGHYVRLLEPRLRDLGATVDVPTRGLGIGKQLAFYAPIPADPLRRPPQAK